MPELDGLSSFTVQLWFNADQWTEGATLLSRGEEFSVKLGGTNTLVITSREKTISLKRDEFVTGTWIPLMILSLPTRTQVYVDNTMVRNVSSPGTLPETSNRFVFGGDSFRGRIDEVRVWNTELSSDHEYFTHTTLNKWTPQLNNLVAYFKFDQPWCNNLVDYKPLFDANAKTNHHGVFSATGATREKVTDNAKGLPYLLMGAYTNTERFFDSGIEADKYLLSNDLIILGLQCYDDGHVRPITSNDHAKVRNGTYLENYKTTKLSGVLSLEGSKSSYILCPENVLSPSGGFTLETWICVDEWNEGAYIFKKENTSLGKGMSVRLGSEASRELIVRIDGREYFFTNTIRTGSWAHLAITPGSGNNTLICNVSGRSIGPNAQSDTSKVAIPADMSGLALVIGQNLNAKLDETMIWDYTQDFTEIANHRQGIIPMPGPNKRISADRMWTNMAYYRYDYPDDLGFDSYSQDEWRNIMARCYDGYTGYQIRISVQAYGVNWQSVISNAEKRKIFAADVAECSKPYDGVELDLEWETNTQTNLALLCDEILARLPKGKTLMVSQHSLYAYKYPTDKINTINGFTFQNYSGSPNLYTYQSFVDCYNGVLNYGYPKDKLYFSYGSTTSSGFDSNGNWAADIIGYNWGILPSGYEPATDGSAEAATWNGNTHYFSGPVQVYNRAKFVRDNQMMGLFYWDMCNDISPSNKFSLTRNANYALNANVDPRVESVTPNHPTAIENLTLYKNGTPLENNAAYDLQGRRINPAAVSKGIIIQNGKKIIK